MSEIITFSNREIQRISKELYNRPDYIDIIRIKCNEKVKCTNIYNIPEYSIRSIDVGTFWKKYCMYWIIREQLLLHERNVYLDYFWS